MLCYKVFFYSNEGSPLWKFLLVLFYLVLFEIDVSEIFSITKNFWMIDIGLLEGIFFYDLQFGGGVSYHL